MLHAKFLRNRSTGSGEEDFLRVYTIYGHGGHLGHVTLIIYIHIDSPIIFFGTSGPISKKLCMKHRWLKYYNVYINHDPVMTLTHFKARSTWVAYVFEWVNC